MRTFLPIFLVLLLSNFLTALSIRAAGRYVKQEEWKLIGVLGTFVALCLATLVAVLILKT